VKFEPAAGAGLDEVRGDGFERSQGGTDQGEDEAPGGEVVVAIGTGEGARRQEEWEKIGGLLLGGVREEGERIEVERDGTGEKG
jgi:hypothetical protein